MEHGGPMDFGDHGGDDSGDGYDGDQLGAPIEHGGTGGEDSTGEPIGAHGPEEPGADEHAPDEYGYDPDSGTGEGSVGLEFGDLSDEYSTEHSDGADTPVEADQDSADDPTQVPEPVTGAEPDLDLVGDDPHWATDDPFPPQLDVGEPPEPVDGFPWSDPAVLGEQHDTGTADATPGAAQDSPPPGDLLDYDAQEVPAGGDPWQALTGSEDPATSSLARWWSPST